MSGLIFIRHAETDMAGTFCGHSDPDLNERGRAQLKGIVRELQTETIDAVYTSNLRRAYTTAQAIASAFEVECHARAGLREIDFGQWEGLTWAEVEQRDRAYAQRWLDDYPNLPAPGGERFWDFEQRVLDEVEALGLMAEGRPFAVVTHAGVLRTVLQRLYGCSEEDASRQTQSYGCILRPACSVSSGKQPGGVKA